MPRSPRSQPRGHVSRPWPREGRGEPGSCACSRERLPWRRHGHRRSSGARGRGRGSEMFPEREGGGTSVCLLVQDAVTIILLSHHRYSSPIAATLGLTRSRGRVWAGRTQRVRRGSARGVGLRRGPRNASPRTRSATVPISSARFRGVSPILHAVRREPPAFRRFRRPGCPLPGPCSGRLLPAFQRRKTAGGAAGEALVPRQQGGARGGPATRRPEQGRGQRPSALSPARGPSPGDAPPCLPRKALWAAIVSLS